MKRFFFCYETDRVDMSEIQPERSFRLSFNKSNRLESSPQPLYDIWEFDQQVEKPYLEKNCENSRKNQLNINNILVFEL